MKTFLGTRQILKEVSQNEKLPVREVVAEVARKVQKIWKKGGIPTVSNTRAVQILTTYHSKYRALLKNLKSRKVQQSFQNKMKEFEEKARVTLYDISACKCMDFEKYSCDKSKRMPVQERKILTDQRNLQMMYIGALNKEETARRYNYINLD